MKDQGEYRSIFVMLADDEEFVSTTPLAKAVFYTLKLKLPAIGIGSMSMAVLSALVNSQKASVEVACDELSPKWVRRDRSVFWIVNGLACHPSLAINNPKHRTYVLAQLNALPRAVLVNAFKDHYRDWFDTAKKPLPNGLDTVPERIGYKKTEEEDVNSSPLSASTASVCDIDVSAYSRAVITSANQGMRDHPAIGQSFNPIPHGHANSHNAAEALIAAGVPLEFAQAVVYEISKCYQPTNRSRQVSSTAFFTAQVIERWERQQATAAVDAAPRPGAAPALPQGRSRMNAVDRLEATMAAMRRQTQGAA